MNTLTTCNKYTLILSAYQASNSDVQNLIDTELMQHYLEHECHVHAIRAVGVYHGGAEQSFVVHTNSANIMAQIRRYAYDECHQECVLVRHNRQHTVKLHNSDGFNKQIGTEFMCMHSAPRNHQDYTILNGKDYYIVR